MRLHKFSDKVSSVARSYAPSDLLVTPMNFIGIEVELEGAHKANPLFQDPQSEMYMYWEAIADQSLRNGVELRTRAPLLGLDLVKAINVLDKTLKQMEHNTSIRTSTHVHFDMALFRTTEDLLKLLALSGMFEKVLFNYVGGDREDSIYCLPYEKSRGDFDLISTLNGQPRYLGDRLGRYQAINLQSIYKHGTIEFRHSGALTTSEELLEWVNILGSLIKYAGADNFDVKELSGICSAKTPVDFLREVFPTVHEKLMYDGIGEDIIRGARMVDDLIHRAPLIGKDVYRGMDDEDGGLANEIFAEKIKAIPEPVFSVYDDIEINNNDEDEVW